MAQSGYLPLKCKFLTPAKRREVGKVGIGDDPYLYGTRVRLLAKDCGVGRKKSGGYEPD